jgi:endoglucanase Acf2
MCAVFRVADFLGSKLLMMALPHHFAVLYNNSYTPDTLYRVVIGKMHGIWGPTWYMKETYSNITWTAPRPVCRRISPHFSSSLFFYSVTVYCYSVTVLCLLISTCVFFYVSYCPHFQLDKTKIPDIIDALKADIRGLKTLSNDTYFYGKYAGALARLVLIADEIGDPMSKRQALAKLTKAIEPWIGGIARFYFIIIVARWLNS